MCAEGGEYLETRWKGSQVMESSACLLQECGPQSVDTTETLKDLRQRWFSEFLGGFEPSLGICFSNRWSQVWHHCPGIIDLSFSLNRASDAYISP